MNIHIPNNLKPSRSTALCREERRFPNRCNHLSPPLGYSMATKTHLKKHIIHPFLVPALIAALNLAPVGPATAQTFTTLHSFSGGGGANCYALF